MCGNVFITQKMVNNLPCKKDHLLKKVTLYTATLT